MLLGYDSCKHRLLPFCAHNSVERGRNTLVDVGVTVGAVGASVLLCYLILPDGRIVSCFCMELLSGVTTLYHVQKLLDLRVVFIL